jgi:hypothetical protein
VRSMLARAAMVSAGGGDVRGRRVWAAAGCDAMVRDKRIFRSPRAVQCDSSDGVTQKPTSAPAGGEAQV